MSRTATTHARFGVALMLFVTVSINYLDRSNLSVAATGLATDLRLGPERLGLVFSAFGWTYALFQIPGGWLVDRVAPRVLFAATCALWSVATFAQGFAGTFLALLGLRLLVGLFEAPSFPICNKLATRWFPEKERAGAIGFYTSGQYLGLAFLTPLLALAQRHFGWRSVFVLTGVLGLAWAVAWYLRYRDPAQSRRLGAAERDHIRAGGGWVEAEARPPFALRASDLRFVLSQRKLWGLYLGQFGLNSLPWFFLTWFPTYLVESRHIDLVKAGVFSSLPFLAGFLGVICGGLFSDYLARLGMSQSAARKTPVIAGMLLSSSVVFANFTGDTRWVVFFMTLAFFGNGFASITWVLVSLIAPKPLLGLTGGVFNFFGNLAAVAVPLTIGVIVAHWGYASALSLIGALAIGGVLSYLFLVRNVARLEIG